MTQRTCLEETLTLLIWIALLLLVPAFQQWYINAAALILAWVHLLCREKVSLTRRVHVLPVLKCDHKIAELVSTLSSISRGCDLQDVLRLYAFSALLQLLIFIPYAARAAHFHQSARSIAIRILDAFLHAAPPGLPAVMLFCGGANRGRLAKQGINLVFPEKLGLAAGTTVVAFDKTGTLTGTVVSISPREA